MKEFATGEERQKYLAAFLKQVITGNRELAAYWEIALGLYKDEIEKILRQEKITMSIVEKNIDAWMDDLGLKEKYKNEGREEGLRKGQKRIVFRMRKQGYSIKEISEATDCSQAQIKKFLAEGEE